MSWPDGSVLLKDLIEPNKSTMVSTEPTQGPCKHKLSFETIELIKTFEDTCTHIIVIVCTELRNCLARASSHPPPSELISLVLELLLHLDDLIGGCLHPTAWKPEPKAASQEVATTPAWTEAQPICGRQLQQPTRDGSVANVCLSESESRQADASLASHASRGPYPRNRRGRRSPSCR